MLELVQCVRGRVERFNTFDSFSKMNILLPIRYLFMSLNSQKSVFKWKIIYLHAIKKCYYINWNLQYFQNIEPKHQNILTLEPWDQWVSKNVWHFYFKTKILGNFFYKWLHGIIVNLKSGSIVSMTWRSLTPCCQSQNHLAELELSNTFGFKFLREMETCKNTL